MLPNSEKTTSQFEVTATQLPTTVSPTVPTPFPTPTRAETFDQVEIARMALAVEGVSANEDWQPLIKAFEGIEMALVPAGCFMMGSSDEQIEIAVQLALDSRFDNAISEWYADESPVHQVCISKPFWIDVYEVTNDQYGRRAATCIQYSKEDDQPRVCLSWGDAQDHCGEREARLPTEAEWEYAARGADSLLYPWGNTFVGRNVIYFADPKWVAEVVGSRPGGMSWVGAYDLSGNIAEWVNDWYNSDYYARSPKNDPQGVENGTNRVWRGGSWIDASLSDLRSARRKQLEPAHQTEMTLGFRCARSFDE